MWLLGPIFSHNEFFVVAAGGCYSLEQGICNHNQSMNHYKNYVNKIDEAQMESKKGYRGVLKG